MSILSIQFIGDTVARLLGVMSNLAPKQSRRFPEIPRDTYTIAVQTRHGKVKCTVFRPTVSSTTPPVYVNVHGGGFVIRYPEQDDPLCRYLAARAGVLVINVDYTTAPRGRFPVAIEQLYDVLRWASSDERKWDGTRICIGGQSAGGAIAAGAARLALEKGGPKIALQVLHYPAIDLDSSLKGRPNPTGKPIVPPWMEEVFITAYIPDPNHRKDRLASPAYGSNGDHIQGIAPALVISAENDPLRKGAAEYAKKLAASGSLVEYRDIPGAKHGYDILNESETLTHEMYDLIVQHVKRAVGVG